MTEKTRLTISVSDRILERNFETDPVLQDHDIWTSSSPLSGVVIINTWEIYHLQKIVLVVTESGHYQIFRSVNMKRFSNVHDHATEIYNIFYIDEGVALFSATDGWWSTTTAGVSWNYLDDGVGAKAVATVQIADGEWEIFACGVDKKIYARNYPTGTWSEVYDATILWSGKWYPAIAGGVAGILVGIGPYLIRSEDLGESWQVVQNFEDRVVKNIIVSSRSNAPVYLVETDLDGKSQMWWTRDVGDSVTLDETRFDAVEHAQSVIPTGGDTETPKIVMFGRRTPTSDKVYDVIEV